MYIYIHIRICICVHIYIYIYIHTRVHIYMYTCIYVYIYIHIHIYVYTIYTCTTEDAAKSSACVRTLFINTHTYSRTCILYIDLFSTCLSLSRLLSLSHLQTHTFANAYQRLPHVCVYVRVSASVCMYAHEWEERARE